MFKITEQQVEMLSAQSLEKYKRGLCQEFRTEFPSKTANRDDAALYAVVSKSVDDALELGVKMTDAMKRYVGLAVFVNEDFAQAPDVQNLFAHSGIDADFKVHLLSDRVIEELRRI